ncbi:MAG: M23 family metallopeptidase, partial [Bacteroidales bacterium]
MYFAYPVDKPVLLSANFGELRTNHFHAGLDFKTQGREGMSIYAVEDGYVSGIYVSGSGYGNSLFITHKNGLTTFYSHLLDFNTEIKKYIQDYQYANKINEFKLWLTADSGLYVKKCEKIGLSGNTGSSRGPHLHFETIETATGDVLNPLSFFPALKDNRAPMLYNIKLYPADSTGFING